MSPQPRAALLAITALALGPLSLPPGYVPPAGAQPGKAPAARAKDAGGWRTLFDGKSLAGWKSVDFGGEGKVYVKDGALLMEKGKQMTGVVYTRGDFPRSDYEVALEAKKLTGDDFFCTTTFPVGDSHCSLVVGGWGGTVVGLSSVDGADASENETSGSKEFQRDRWYRVRVRVTGKKIEAWIDNDKVVGLETEGRKISVRLECRPCRPFGVATWDTVGAVRAIRVRALGATGEKGKGERPKANGKE